MHISPAGEDLFKRQGEFMRLRNIPGAKEAIADSKYCVQEPETFAGQWNRHFPKDQPLHIEIGMGKGKFLMELAATHPEINYLGIERYTSVLYRAVQKMELCPLPNLYFVCFDAARITELCAPGEVERIYLNFSDPWPKDRHARRRLTSPDFLARYREIIDGKGRLEFKTDNRGLFDYSVETVKDSDQWELAAVTYDLHHDETLCQGNIMTEYEEKFSALGNPICKLIAVPRPCI